MNRVFLNLQFARLMDCMRVAFHENDGNHENGKNDEDNSDSYSAGLVEITNQSGAARELSKSVEKLFDNF